MPSTHQGILRSPVYVDNQSGNLPSFHRSGSQCRMPQGCNLHTHNPVSLSKFRINSMAKVGTNLYLLTLLTKVSHIQVEIQWRLFNPPPPRAGKTIQSELRVTQLSSCISRTVLLLDPLLSKSDHLTHANIRIWKKYCLNSYKYTPTPFRLNPTT